jgi:hypothetical protein
MGQNLDSSLSSIFGGEGWGEEEFGHKQKRKCRLALEKLKRH